MASFEISVKVVVEADRDEKPHVVLEQHIPSVMNVDIRIHRPCVETFICGENAVVYQKDLGPNTAALGTSMAQYNPDASWKVVE